MRTPPHRRMSRRAAIFDRVHVDDRPAPLQSQRPHSRSSLPPRYMFGVPAGLVLRLRPGFSRSSAAKPRFANLKTSPQFAQRTDPRPQRHDPLALPASKPHLGTSTHGRPADPRRTTSASASSLSRVSSAGANTMPVPRPQRHTTTPLRRFAAPAVRDDAPVVQAYIFFRASREYLCTSRYSCHGSVYYFVRVYMQVSI